MKKFFVPLLLTFAITFSCNVSQQAFAYLPWVNTDALMVSDCQSFLERCQHGDKFSINEITELCENTKIFLSQEPTLLEASAPMMIVGDIHGNLDSLADCCNKFFEEVLNGTSILFLGDYVDRGKQNIECLLMIFKLKTAFPNKVYLLRGNHELLNQNFCYENYETLLTQCETYFSPCLAKCAADMCAQFNDVFNYLSLALVIDGHTFCVHGGISPKLITLDDISSIQKPIISIKARSNELITDLLWSDPSDIFDDFVFNQNRNVGKLFGENDLLAFRFNTGCRRIIRGHEYKSEGHSTSCDDSVITIFSSANYCDQGRSAAFAIVRDEYEIEYYDLPIHQTIDESCLEPLLDTIQLC